MHRVRALPPSGHTNVSSHLCLAVVPCAILALKQPHAAAPSHRMRRTHHPACASTEIYSYDSTRKHACKRTQGYERWLPIPSTPNPPARKRTKTQGYEKCRPTLHDRRLHRGPRRNQAACPPRAERTPAALLSIIQVRIGTVNIRCSIHVMADGGDATAKRNMVSA